MAQQFGPILALALVVLSAGGAAQQAPANVDAQVLADFKNRVGEYVELRKKADNKAPDMDETKNPAKIRDAQQGLAERIRQARAGAKRGEIFTPEIATQFRRLLRPELKERGTKPLLNDDNPGDLPFKVNGAYPEKEPLSTVPPNVLKSLPELPKDIDYRFFGKHLLLRDSRANLIIDYMLNAIS